MFAKILWDLSFPKNHGKGGGLLNILRPPEVWLESQGPDLCSAFQCQPVCLLPCADLVSATAAYLDESWAKWFCLGT